MSLTEVSSILWRERELLDLLLFKLEEERLLVAAGLTRWLSRATYEVDLVLAELRRIERPRTIALDDLAAELGLGPGQTLLEVAAAAPPPWDTLLEQHREAFVVAIRAIAPLQQAHRELVDSGETEAVVAWLQAGDARPPLRAVPSAG